MLAAIAAFAAHQRARNLILFAPHIIRTFLRLATFLRLELPCIIRGLGLLLRFFPRAVLRTMRIIIIILRIFIACARTPASRIACLVPATPFLLPRLSVLPGCSPILLLGLSALPSCSPLLLLLLGLSVIPSCSCSF